MIKVGGDGMNAVATCLSAAETARLNGIDLEEWLNDYSAAAYKHAYAKGWTQAYREGKDPNKKIQKWPMEKLLEATSLSASSPSASNGRATSGKGWIS